MEAYDTWERPNGYKDATYLFTQNPHLFERRPAPLITDSYDCSAAKYPSGPNGVEIISLFTPRVLPWSYSKVCFLGYNGAAIGSGASTITVNVQVVMYEADPATGLPRTTPVNVQAPTTTTLSQVDSWSELSVTNLTAWSSRVFIGLRIVSQCHRAFYHTSYITRPRMSFWRPVSLAGQPSGGWSTPVLDWDTANDSHVLVRTLGQPMVPSVPGWTCSASLYNDGSTCNCECGAWDPDCKKNPVSATCGSGQVCGRSGHCLSPGWNTAVCPLASFGTGDGCHCGCGGTAIDPDCVETTENNWHPKAVNCPGVSKCNAQGACETAWTAAACTSSRYGDGVCDCECQVPGGVRDPDCWDADGPSTCGDNGTCYEGVCRPVPRGWTCSPVSWGDKLCDCNCGVFDTPGCQMPRQSYFGCVSNSLLPSTSCNLDGVCAQPLCGNGVKDEGEQCDGGIGCNSQCMCLPHWNGAAGSVYCSPDHTDNFIVGDEDCAGGLGCDPTTSKCLPGHSPYTPRSLGCTGCGNSIIDPGEQCDSGVGCSNCSCLAGYLQTVPPTIGCTKINYKCGDVAVQGNEECDGGKFCTVNCTCMPGHSPMSPRVPSCTGCGNSIIESGEACDSGTNCNQTECVCLAGFVPTSPVSLGCIKETQNCGNGVVQTGEECDSGAFCRASDCKCSAGHTAYTPARRFCSGCGNGAVDTGEQCDGGEGCNATDCMCQAGYSPAQPLARWCHVLDSSTGNTTGNATHGGSGKVFVKEELETDLGPVIGVPVAMGFVVAGAAALAVVQIYRTRHRRMAPEMSGGTLVSVPNTDLQFVPASATSITFGDASPLQQSPGMGPPSLTSSFHIRATAPDGTPIIVVPVPPSPLSGGSGGLATSGGVATTTSSGSGSSGFVPVI